MTKDLADELERLAKALFDEPDAARRIYRSVALSLWVENNLPRIISALRREEPASLTREGEPVACPACYRGEVFGLATDDGFWVEMGASAGGAHEHGMNGWLELIEHHPDGTEKRREYVATDSPLYTRPPAWPDRDRIAVCIATHLSLRLGIDLPCVEVDKIADAILALSASGGGE